MGNMKLSIGIDLRKVATDSMLAAIEQEIRLTIKDEENFQEFIRNVKIIYNLIFLHGMD